VPFRSLDANATVLDGYLYRAAGEGRHPAVVFLHGCGGMFSRSTGLINRIYQDWATALTGAGYSVLMIDRFRPRGIDFTCSPATYNRAVVEDRPKDAHGALYYLQKQPFVRGDRIALIGWSAGGGTVLRTISRQSRGRPPVLPQGDFRAAVAFYPALCSDQREPASWSSDIPLLVLIGAADVWTPAAPCQSFIAGAIARGAPIEMQIYPGAYHSFDAPSLPVRELPQFRTLAGVVPITGTDSAARQDVFARVPKFLARFLGD
jgi:dienelactone hydrolase